MGMPRQGETPSGTSTRPRPEGSTLTERVRPPKRHRDSRGPGTYKEALTNTKIANLKVNFSEDKLTEDEQGHILEKQGKVFCGTLRGELPHLRSFMLEGGALMHVCADQKSGQWRTGALSLDVLSRPEETELGKLWRCPFYGPRNA
jgi:hypothetical protein